MQVWISRNLYFRMVERCILPISIISRKLTTLMGTNQISLDNINADR
jgi:hypothetical protein